MREVLAALGLAWPRVLIYPGGIVAVLLACLLTYALARAARRPLPPLRRSDLWLAVPALVGLSVLPLAPARSFPYGIDLMVALGLFTVPRLHSLARSGGFAPERLAQIAPIGVLLVLGGSAMAGGAGSIELSALLRSPATAWGWSLLLAGGLGWVVALALLDRSDHPPAWAYGPGDLGLLIIAGLPLLALLAASLAEYLPAGSAGWLLPPLALALTSAALLAIRRIL